MVTMNLHYGMDHTWDSDLIVSIWKSAAQNYWPDQTHPHYCCGAGVSLLGVANMITEMVDFTGEEVLLIGRAPVVDGLLNEMMQSPSHDVKWSDGNRLGTVGWWRGCLIVRMLYWQFDMTRITYQDGTAINTDFFPQNELWLLPLAEARLGEAHLLYRYIDTTLPP